MVVEVVLSHQQRAQLKAWFQAQKNRRAPGSSVLEFPLDVDEVFGSGPRSGAALGVDYVEAMREHTLVDVGPVPAGGFRGERCRSHLLRIEQRMRQHGIGAVVWDCGRTICRFASRLPECEPSGRLSARVLDLGTGTGVVGIACWLRGADVTLTDVPEMLDLGRANALATLGDMPETLRVMPHVWGSDAAPLDPPFDLVFASDCLYDVDALPALLDTVLAVSDGGTVVYLAYKRRIDDRERPFFHTLQRHFGSVTFSDPRDTPAEWRGDGLFVCRLASKKSCAQ
ncbi:hypothetical protein CTAYLR_002737 [Chrysophaeum taylorii]|uniref:Uncharacterized protein n=1 Tax=Chrysophaeum taylorii TaxID=2483200 RepID=A0AAD7XKY8_9STRA|nr:hypothetical protein CTAYLR_002737 [Chrysophaeum taylorii]